MLHAVGITTNTENIGVIPYIFHNTLIKKKIGACDI